MAETDALVIRTNFSNDVAWKEICAAVSAPVDLGGFELRANVAFLSDRKYENLTSGALVTLVPTISRQEFVIVADAIAMSDPEHSLLVVDLLEEPGRHFRALPGQIQGIENNLSIGNMGFDEFAGAVDDRGVFRGFDGIEGS